MADTRNSSQVDLEKQHTGEIASQSSSHTINDIRANDFQLTHTQSSRWQRPRQESRPDLEPGAEYHLTKSRTPARDPNYHDPAIWPNDLVDWDSPNDPANPRNWPLRKKIIVTVQLGITTMGASFASSSFSPAFPAIQEVFGIGRTVATLSLSLFVLGYVIIFIIHRANADMTF